jgi:hypothetical protein
VDCSGDARPGLAESWFPAENNTVWTFTLREGARFWDGSPVTTSEVRNTFLHEQGFGVKVLDERRLSFFLAEPHDRFPLALAHATRAIATQRPGWTWPLGSGPCRLRASDPAPLPDLTCLPNQNHPDWPRWKSLTFHVLPGTDPRDLVATDLDLLLVRDMNAVGFFAAAPGFRSYPLPWNRLYLLVCPPDMNPPDGDMWIRAAAALDVDRDLTAARDWEEIAFPAGGLDNCSGLSGPVHPPGSAKLDWDLGGKNLDPNVLVYPGNDPGAREMAHRLGALAGPAARTAALPAPGVDFVLHWQMTGAVLVSLDQSFPTGCGQLEALLRKADWLQKAALGRRDEPLQTLAGAEQVVALPQRTPAEALVLDNLVRPLGLGRSWLVVRGSLAGLELSYDGIPLLWGLGAAAEASGEATP